MKRSEERSDIHKTLGKLPKSHRALLRGYKFSLQGGNTLAGDDEHIGYMDSEEEEIAIAAPWNYSREMTMLHEIAHLIWERLSKELKQEWSTIVKRTKNKQDQSEEELFCMAYASTYAKNPPTIHDHAEWKNFIEKLPK